MKFRLVSCGFSSIKIQWLNQQDCTKYHPYELQLRSMDRQLLENLDYNQKFDEIEIESEQQSIKLKDVTFDQAMGKLQEQVTEMADSNFYKTITVHFAAKTAQTFSYLEEHYEKKQEILRLELEDEKEYLKSIVDAQDDLELQIREKQHRRNLLIIQNKKQRVKFPNFIPCLYIHAERKNSIYGSLNQAFDRKGMGNFTSKLGYRSPFLKYDSLELNLDWPVSNIGKKYFQGGLEWSNPFKFGNSTLYLRHANQYIFKGIDNKMNSIGWSTIRGKNRFEIDVSHRSPLIYGDIYKVMREEFYRPSRKVSLKYQYTIKDDIKFEDVIQGQRSQMKAQLGLPFLGHSNFFKVQYSFRRFFDTYKVRNWLDNELAKKFFWKSTLQTNFSVSAIQEFGRQRYVNDVLDSLDIRGYEPSRNPVPSFANAKGSLKFNLHNYPVLQEARIVSFLYAQAGLAFLKQYPLKPFRTASFGLGLSLYAGPTAQIEVLCNAAQYQNYNYREPVNFQIRFGIYD